MSKLAQVALLSLIVAACGSSPSTDGGSSTDGGNTTTTDGGSNTTADGGGGTSGAVSTTCMAVVAAVAHVNTTYAPCQGDGGSQVMTISQTQCEQMVAACSASDLTVLSSFATCANGVATCSPSMAQSWWTSVQACNMIVAGSNGSGGVSAACQTALGINGSSMSGGGNDGGMSGGGSDGGMSGSDGGSSGSGCQQMCANNNPAAFQVFTGLVLTNCGCDSGSPCASSCTAECSSMSVDPSSACGMCLSAQESMGQSSTCTTAAGEACFGNSACTPFVQCAVGCPP